MDKGRKVCGRGEGCVERRVWNREKHKEREQEERVEVCRERENLGVGEEVDTRERREKGEMIVDSIRNGKTDGDEGRRR